MTAPLVAIAEALRAELAARVEHWRPARRYVPRTGPRELGDDLVVVIMPKRDEREPRDRGSNAHELAVDVGFFARVDAAATDRVDALLDEVDRLKRLFDADEEGAGAWQHAGALRQADFAGYSWAGIANDPVFDNKLLHDGIFASVVTLDFVA